MENPTCHGHVVRAIAEAVRQWELSEKWASLEMTVYQHLRLKGLCEEDDIDKD